MPIYTEYIAATILYNLQILPESLICGIIILSVILANQSLVALAAGAIGTQFLTSAVGRLIMKMTNNAKPSSSMDTCATGYVGKSLDRLLRGTNDPDLMWHPQAPSIFLATIAYFIGYGWALQQVYKEEIDARVMSKGSLVLTAIISFLLLVTAIVYRVSSGCDSITGALCGVAFGLSIGFLGCITLGYASDRRATNVWGIPLRRDRINNGSALYICPKGED
jgi:hypothetical protein